MEIFRILGTVAIDGAKEAADVLGEIGTAAVKVGKVVATGLAAGSAAIGALAKQSLDSYAEYEQLVGGVDTLFKESSKMLQGYAANAYKTAGLSANEYMETVTSFSASLLQSLGGDTTEACNYANMAITDMSDNANKMGTSMSSIQTAYQGFAKQNYTMLDNLKLGYGGTAQEMFRLLSDAKEIDETFDAVFSIDTKGHLEAGYADIVKAIHIVQNEMGITGTTAKEASSTIQGSLSATKSAWKNLLTGFADGNQDLNLLIGNLVTSATTAANNIIPRITEILGGISSALAQIIPVVSAELPAILQGLLPGLISGAVALINGLVSALPSLVQILIEQLPSVIAQISQGLIQTFPVLLQTFKDLFKQLWDYVAVELLGTEAKFETSFLKIQEILQKAWEVIQSVWQTVGQPIFDMVMFAVDEVQSAFAERMPEIREFVGQCFEDIGVFWEDNLKPCLEAIGNFLENVVKPVFEEVFTNFIGPCIDTVFGFIKNLWENTLKPVFTGITDFLTGIFTLNFKQAFEGIVSIVKGIFNGIIEVVKYPINQVINLINSFIGGLNKLTIPDWVPGFGGKGINIPLIPQLAEGGILEKGQMGFLEGTGAEAVVPLDQNRAWISAVAKDMNAAVGGDNERLQKIVDLLQTLIDTMPEVMMDAFASMKFDVNNREFARMVKAVG